jgi:hypothetical protein
VAAPEGHVLVGAWAPKPFADSLDAIATLTGRSRAHLVRLALTEEMLSIAEPEDDDGPTAHR